MNTKKRRLTARINVMMEPKQRKQVEAKAKKYGLDLTEAVRIALYAWCNDYDDQVPGEVTK